MDSTLDAIKNVTKNLDANAQFSFGISAGASAGSTSSGTATAKPAASVGGSGTTPLTEQEISDDSGRKRHRSGGVKRSRDSQKIENFQLRVKIIKARRLSGGNLRPVVKIKCGSMKSQITRKKKGSDATWNESKVFLLMDSMKNVQDVVTEISVCDSHSLRSDTLIGSFKFDLGSVYDQEGFLKVTVSVLGTGDVLPATDDGRYNDDDDDIEDNLLLPVGAELRTVFFILNVYHAEDLPDMDYVMRKSKKGNQVDPYLKFSFAGIERTTSTKKETNSPVWNEQLILPLKFPTFCENLKIELFDWDRANEDDFIGGVTIPITSISRAGENNESGFLPTLGPVFINMYAPPFEKANKEFLYRGRVLVELKTHVKEIKDLIIRGPIPKKHLDEFQRCRRDKKISEYRLVVTFQEASMIEKVDKPITFEVSIGKYKESFTSDKQLILSTAKGIEYYYLPFGAKKPMVLLKSFWEDVEFRYAAINLILREIWGLEMGIARTKNKIQSKRFTQKEIATAIIGLFERIIEFCKSFGQYDLDPNEIAVGNLLDTRIYDIRRKTFREWKLRVENEKKTCTDVSKGMQVLKEFVKRLKELAKESQKTIPDISIRIIFEKFRQGFVRIPANEVLFSKEGRKFCGQMCGRMQNINLEYPVIEPGEFPPIACQLQATIWLGLSKYEKDYIADFASEERNIPARSVSVFAETFEKKSSIPSPASFEPLPKQSFKLPKGWKWKGEWEFIHAPIKRRDIRATEVQEAYEEQERTASGEWSTESTFYDYKGTKIPSLDAIKCQEHWAVIKNWAYVTRIEGDEGWEFSSSLERDHAIWRNKEKPASKRRRRQWYRKTKCVDLEEQAKIEEKLIKSEDGWMKTSEGRRRHWIRTMKPENPSEIPDFFSLDWHKQLHPDTSSRGEVAEQDCNFDPRICLNFEECVKLQVRVYIYQARNLLSVNKISFTKTTPYVYAFFMTQSKKTKKLDKSVKKTKRLNPCWDQTLIMHMDYYGEIYHLKTSCPKVILQIYDKNAFGQSLWMGQTEVDVMLQIDKKRRILPTLTWCDIKKGNIDGGAILATAELLSAVPRDKLPPELLEVPRGIKPTMKKYHLDILIWGVRDLKPYMLLSVGDVEISSDVIKDVKKLPNFQTKLFRKEVNLPVEESYWPPLIIRVKDHRRFGLSPTVGEAVITDLSEFIEITKTPDTSQAAASETPEELDTRIEITTSETQETATKYDIHHKEIDWWSKYYASVNEKHKKDGKPENTELLGECERYSTTGLDTLEIYDGELEDQMFNEELGQGYDRFYDVVRSFPLYRREADGDDESGESVGEFKGQISIYELPEDEASSELFKAEKTKPKTIDSDLEEKINVKVRVYVIRAYDLPPQDSNGLADPYIIVSAGKKSEGDRSDYKPNTLEPTFGNVYEMDLMIPIDKDLKIEVFDWDAIGKDDKIGETVIDLENRYYSKYWAWFGLPNTYCSKGSNKWRWLQKPTKLLDIRAKMLKLEKPSWNGKTVVTFDDIRYSLSTMEKDVPKCADWGEPDQRLALYVLRNYPHVKEHVETRTLYSDAIPGIPQGKLELWVDMFPKEYGQPEPIANITPRKALKYYVRVVVWNCSKVPLIDTSITGEKMTDMYVKGWMEGMQGSQQKTDTHYRSLNGTGMFNWRFVFPIDYLPQERRLVASQKEHMWSLNETSGKYVPTLHLQIWDEDCISSNDYLSEVSLSLLKLPEGSSSAGSATLSKLPGLDGKSVGKTHNLFERAAIKGWWPLYSIKDGKRQDGGKIEMTIEVLTEEAHKTSLAGKGRDEPNEHPKLEKPKRPPTSFRWFSSPLKSFYYIIWKKYKYRILALIISAPFIAFIVMMVYTMPSSINNKLVGSGGKKV